MGAFSYQSGYPFSGGSIVGKPATNPGCDACNNDSVGTEGCARCPETQGYHWCQACIDKHANIVHGALSTTWDRPLAEHEREYNLAHGKDSNMDTQTTYQLEEMVDSRGLADVVNMLADICQGKASHLQENWQNDASAKAWARAGFYLSTVAGNNKLVDL